MTAWTSDRERAHLAECEAEEMTLSGLDITIHHLSPGTAQDTLYGETRHDQRSYVFPGVATKGFMRYGETPNNLGKWGLDASRAGDIVIFSRTLLATISETLEIGDLITNGDGKWYEITKVSNNSSDWRQLHETKSLRVVCLLVEYHDSSGGSISPHKV